MAVVEKDIRAFEEEEKLKRDLRKAQGIINRKYRDELIEWWERVKETAKKLCPVDTGTLRRSIRVVRLAEANIGLYAEKAVFASPLVNRMIVAGGSAYINPKTKRPCDYATYVHDGHRIPSGGFVPPRPFLTDAVNLHLPELERILDKIFEAIK